MPRTVPVTTTEAPGNYIVGALWNAGPKALGDFILAPPLCVAYQTSVQSMANATWVSAALDSTLASTDSDGGHSNVTNNSRYTCQVAGFYRVHGFITFASNLTGYRAARIAKNGTALPVSESYSSQASGVLGQTAYAWGTVQLAVGDYVEIQGNQNSGGALNTVANAEVGAFLDVLWVHS